MGGKLFPSSLWDSSNNTRDLLSLDLLRSDEHLVSPYNINRHLMCGPEGTISCFPEIPTRKQESNKKTKESNKRTKKSNKKTKEFNKKTKQSNKKTRV